MNELTKVKNRLRNLIDGDEEISKYTHTRTLELIGDVDEKTLDENELYWSTYTNVLNQILGAFIAESITS